MLNMACCLSTRARLNHPPKEKKIVLNNGPCGPPRPPRPVLNIHKFRVANSFIQLVSNFGTVIMGKRVCRHCPIPGCHCERDTQGQCFPHAPRRLQTSDSIRIFNAR